VVQKKEGIVMRKLSDVNGNSILSER